MSLVGLNLTKAKLTQLEAKGIHSLDTLLARRPRRYIDATNNKSFADTVEKEIVYFTAQITEQSIVGKNLNLVLLRHDTLEEANMTLFGQAFLAKRMQKGAFIYVAGTVKRFYGRIYIAPIKFSHFKEDVYGIHPVYSKIKNMSESYYKGIIQQALPLYHQKDLLTPEHQQRYALMSTYDAYIAVHQPQNMAEVVEGQRRLRFNDMFHFNWSLLEQKQKLVQSNPYPIPSMKQTKRLLANLPYTLTHDQKETLRNLSNEIREGKLLDALVMGDVGCGKTMVAAIMMLGQIENGYQSVLMAPTSVLATQHYEELETLFGALGYQVAFLNGKTKKLQRAKILKGLAAGTIHVLIGTHAVLNEEIQFQKLSMMIIDEEHRFGVKHRTELKERAKIMHMISMSATPIPRTLALTLYGEHVSFQAIRTLPSNRLPVTLHYEEELDKAIQAIAMGISRNEQAYIVCPLIEESEMEQMEGVASVEETFALIQKKFKRVAMINGRMKEGDIAETLAAFARHEFDVLVSTTIIEVGVNVPNATTMVILNAERFGLSQLWQLKGRVGRGGKQSAAYFVSSTTLPHAQEKLTRLICAKDGFDVAEMDIEMRGAGSLFGDTQSGQNYYIDMMLDYQEENTIVRGLINEIWADTKLKAYYQHRVQYLYKYSEVGTTQ